jgi:probable HAF family extracellular repeat protein
MFSDSCLLADTIRYSITDLGTLGGSGPVVAQGINDSGQVVGTSYTASGFFHAFLWQSGSGMQDLGALGGGNSQANGINDGGQVVGTSSTASGFFHAFL